MLLATEYDNELQKSEAGQVLQLLCAAYPGHPWAVTVKGGVIFIRHLEFGKNWGMNVKFSNVNHDAAVLKREIIKMAGEWLERAGIKRGRYDADQEVNRIDGVPEKHQPHQKLPDDIEIVIAKPEVSRETPIPQAVKDG